MNMIKKVAHPFLEVYTNRFATSHQRVNYSGIFGRFVIATEEIVLSFQSYGTDAIFNEIIIGQISTIHGIAHQLT